MRIQFTTVVKNLLIINVLMFLASLVFKESGFIQLMSGYFPMSERFQIWQPITSMFMHDHNSIGHIFGNMFGLVMFGPRLEMNWGSKKFLTFYMFTGLGAYLIHFIIVYVQMAQLQDVLSPDVMEMIYREGRTVMESGQMYTNEDWHKYNILLNIPIVGASGAIFGILLAYGLRYPNDRVMLLFPPIPMKIKYLLIAYGLYTLFAGIRNGQGDNVAHFAHLGGMLFGFIMLKYWQWKNDRDTMHFQ